MTTATARMYASDVDGFKASSRALFGPIRQYFSQTSPRDPHLRSIELGKCRLTNIRAAAHGVTNEDKLRRSFDPDAIKLLIHNSGRSRFKQNTITLDLTPESAIIYDPVRAYSLHNFCDIDQTALQVPRELFGDDALSKLAKPVMVRSSDNSLARIVASLIRTTMREIQTLEESNCRRVGDSLVHLAQGLVRESVRSEEIRPTNLQALHERIVEYIEAHLMSNDLTVDVIARQMGCSTRYVHRAFEAENMTLDRYIWESRLELSHRELTLSQNRSKTISEIAFACGFNSSAHFSRAFRQKFDVSPRALRSEVKTDR